MGWNPIESAYDAASGAVSDGVDAVGDLAEEAGDAIGGAANNLVDAAEHTGSGLSGVFGGATSAISDTLGRVTSASESALGGFTGAIHNGADDLGRYARDGATEAVDWLVNNTDASLDYENGRLSGDVWLFGAGAEGAVDVDPRDGDFGIDTGVSVGYGDFRLGVGNTQGITPGLYEKWTDSDGTGGLEASLLRTEASDGEFDIFVGPNIHGHNERPDGQGIFDEVWGLGVPLHYEPTGEITDGSGTSSESMYLNERGLDLAGFQAPSADLLRGASDPVTNDHSPDDGGVWGSSISDLVDHVVVNDPTTHFGGNVPLEDNVIPGIWPGGEGHNPIDWDGATTLMAGGGQEGDDYTWDTHVIPGAIGEQGDITLVTGEEGHDTTWDTPATPIDSGDDPGLPPITQDYLAIDPGDGPDLPAVQDVAEAPEESFSSSDEASVDGWEFGGL